MRDQQNYPHVYLETSLTLLLCPCEPIVFSITKHFDPHTPSVTVLSEDLPTSLFSVETLVPLPESTVNMRSAVFIATLALLGVPSVSSQHQSLTKRQGTSVDLGAIEVGVRAIT